MKRHQFIFILFVQIALTILLGVFINFRTPPRQNSEPQELNNSEAAILDSIYPKLSLYIPDLYELYFDGISYDENNNKCLIFSDYCHLRKLGCFDGCLMFTIDSIYNVTKISGCDMPSVKITDTLNISQINKLRRNLYNEIKSGK